MNRTFFAFSTTVAMALLIGCGGGGGGSSSGSSSTSSTTTTGSTTSNTGSTTSTTGSTTSTTGSTGSTGSNYTAASPTFATLSATKVFTYALTGTYTKAGGTSQAISTAVRNEEVDPGSSSANLLLATIDDLSLADGTTDSFIFDNFVTQGANESVFLQSVQQGSTLLTVASAVEVVPGTFTVNGNFNNGSGTNYSGSSAGVKISFSVGALANLTVPYGSYQTYPVTASTDYGNGYTRSGTYYYAPQLGTYIKAVETVTKPNASESVTALLQTAASPQDSEKP